MVISGIIEQRKVRTVHEILYYELCKNNESYSIAVSCPVDLAYVGEFTVNKQFAFFVFNRIVEGIVYPCHLKAIVEDFLAEYDPIKHYGDSYEEEFRCSQRSQDKIKA